MSLVSPPLVQLAFFIDGICLDARALFERVVNLFPADRARPIWDRWARYEYQFGSLEASQALEKRIVEVYPNGMPCITLWLHRIDYASRSTH